MKLPRHVVAKRRKTARGERLDFYFEVPKRVRPEGWPPAIRLPKDPDRRTRDGSAEEIAAVLADAKELAADYAASIADDGLTEPVGSLPWLMAQWRRSGDWKALKPKTKAFYDEGWKHVEKWARKNGNPHVRRVRWKTIYQLVRAYDVTPGVRRQVISVTQRLTRDAHDRGLIDRDPWEGQRNRKWKAKNSGYKVEVWTYDHVKRAVAICDKAGRESVGTAILIGFELMQYPTQIASFRRSEHYDPAAGMFRFNRNKTGVPAAVAVSKALRDRLKDCGLYLVTNERSKQPYDGKRLSKAFRKLLSKDDALKTFEMRWLRHSGVFEARRAGLDLETIADIGAWKSTGAVLAVIDRHYRVPDGELASIGQAKREEYRKESGE